MFLDGPHCQGSSFVVTVFQWGAVYNLFGTLGGRVEPYPLDILLLNIVRYVEVVVSGHYFYLLWSHTKGNFVKGMEI